MDWERFPAPTSGLPTQVYTRTHTYYVHMERSKKKIVWSTYKPQKNINLKATSSLANRMKRTTDTRNNVDLSPRHPAKWQVEYQRLRYSDSPSGDALECADVVSRAGWRAQKWRGVSTAGIKVEFSHHGNPVPWCGGVDTLVWISPNSKGCASPLEEHALVGLSQKCHVNAGQHFFGYKE